MFAALRNSTGLILMLAFYVAKHVTEVGWLLQEK